MHRISKGDLKLTVCKKQSWQFISAAFKKRLLDRVKTILAEMKRSTNTVLTWSDEIFTVEAVTNWENDRLYARNARDFSECSRSYLHRQKATLLMMWASVASDGFKSPLMLASKANSEVYVEILDEKLLLRVTESFDDRHVFTQDRAPAYTSNLTQS
ncbi:uncharacterized protein LOC115212152 [Octopus sinensis]|uniref:Uncharacterized protein LOC115212152 n=1 Tax=Octopus sinensis TaxID=2607531 RepID=A0A6P7SFX1_9MOLL|nr:uncharacterized protein LOC115212152 [Octopus sinensis]